jgi:hypothetical protein
MTVHGHESSEPKIYGLLAEFATADKLIEATDKTHKAGYRHIDCYSPYPVGEIADAMHYKKSEMGAVLLIGGLTGATSGFLMQYFLGAFDYPINVGGRPFLSWPSFIPITFEMGVLTTGLAGLFSLLALCFLPHFHHPLFNVPVFARASCDRFFLCIEAEDAKFDLAATKDFMAGLHPLSLSEVPE